MSCATIAGAVAAIISSTNYNKDLHIFETEKEPDINCKDCKGTGIIILDDESTVQCPCTIEVII
jgi:hypothetical protein